MKPFTDDAGGSAAPPDIPRGGGGRLQGTGLPISGGLLAIVVAGALLLLREDALNPTRPSMAAPTTLDEQAQTVKARLWQDPFAAVARHRETDAEQAPRRPRPPAGHPEALADPSTVFLGVMTFAGPYDEQAERRLRSRHAVLSALGEEGWAPEDSEHLGFFEHRLLKGGSTHEIDVPYEWFSSRWASSAPSGARTAATRERPGHARPGRLLLLWLEESAFRQRPLDKLARLVQTLRKKAPGAGFTLLGPYGSTNLRAMAEAIDACLAPGAECDEPRRQLRGVRIFSPSATIDDAFLFDDGEDSPSLAKPPAGPLAEQPPTLPAEGPPGRLDRRFQQLTGDPDGKSRFVRTIGTDRELAEVLIAELARRGVDPRPRPRDARRRSSHVALISEWDTHYGRALPCAFVAAATGGGDAGDCAGPGAVAPAADEFEDGPEWLHRFSYLRGFDGQLPKTPEEAADSEGRSPDPDSVRASAFERPVGRRRLDYLQRLAGQLRRLDAHLRKTNGGTGLEAVGVLGSDVYDKLLILQALREEFRHILFFTTDLDASLLHPAEYKATRNLIVVSNFGLELAEELQGKIPAFRDGYQTSLFFSTRRALSPEKLRGVEWRRARIYEIGRRGAFDLSETAEPGAVVDATEPAARSASAHPPRTDHLATGLSKNERGPLLGVVLLGLLFCYLYWRSYPASRRSASKRRIRLTTGFLLLGGAAALTILICSQGPEGEPFALFDGISLWPSLYLRYFAAILSLYFLLMSWRSIAQSDEDIERNFLSGNAASALGRARVRSSGEREPPSRTGLGWLAPLRRGLLGLPRFGRGVLRLAGLRFHRFHRQGPASAASGAVSAAWARTSHGMRLPISTSDLEAPEVSARRPLRTYLMRSRLSRRLLRVLPLSLVYFVLCRLFIILTGEPNVPFRGAASQWASLGITIGLAVPLLIILIFWVVDATRLSGRLTVELSSGRTQWPAATLKRFAPGLELEPELAHDWLAIQVIARHSVAIGRLLYAPVIAIVLMIASRGSYFDNWAFPVGLSLVICVSVLYSLYCGATVRRSAEDARSAALRRYHCALIQSEGPDSPLSSAQIRLLIDEIANLRIGAFVPFSQQPWVRAIALLFGGGGSLVLFEYLMLVG